MNITIIRRSKRHYYECFDCGLQLNVKERRYVCPNCGSEDGWHEMN